MGHRVLVVDDQKGVRRLLEELFKKEGYEVNVAVDGKDSVEKVKAYPPDIVLMDMKMPNMNGLEASQEIIKYDQTIPIIMMTAYGEMEVVQKALEVGVKKYITKPFDIIDLRNMVKEVLESKVLFD
ncbi:MAG: response regulator [Syntrophomonadales bacterium]|jgi:two-component system response regulator (stage 0 sporulation protein F)